MKNAERVSAKSHLILLDIGVDPGEVPLNILQPVLEGASLHEDAELQNVWANLLANAADPRKANPVLPSFAPMLKELRNREVRFLEALLDVMAESPRLWIHFETGGFTVYQLMDVCSKAKLLRYPGKHGSISVAEWKANEADITADNRDFAEMMDILQRNRIFEEIIHPKPLDVVTPVARAIETRVNSQDINVETEKFYKFSHLGIAFLNACRAPRESKQENPRDDL